MIIMGSSLIKIAPPVCPKSALDINKENNTDSYFIMIYSVMVL